MERRGRPASAEFTKSVRKQVYKEQDGKCAICGQRTCLEYHHIIPHSKGGNRERCNCLGVCHADHRLLDRLALRYGIYYDMQPGMTYDLPKRLDSNEVPIYTAHP